MQRFPGFRRNFTLLSALFLASRVAAAQDVRYDYDRSVDFSKFKSYRWVEIQGAAHPNQLTDKNIRLAVDAELAKKGLVKVDSGASDLFVAYQVAVDQEKQLNSYGGGWGWRGMAQVTVSNINVGTLVLDVLNPQGQALIWQGTVTNTLDPSGDPDKNQQKLEKAMGKLLKSFPPPKKN